MSRYCLRAICYSRDPETVLRHYCSEVSVPYARQLQQAEAPPSRPTHFYAFSRTTCFTTNHSFPLSGRKFLSVIAEPSSYSVQLAGLMRLLKIADDGRSFSLVHFIGSTVPRYAILSHTWGEEEVTYQDLINDLGVDKTGYNKLTFCAEQAVKDSLEYFWVDTCCINKESSAELSEAITSMFDWYQKSAICYVYLTDVSRKSLGEACNMPGWIWESAFRMSRWFTRGWTLQELVAPRTLVFFSRERECLGDKVSLEKEIHGVTKLPVAVIKGTALALRNYSIEERISWIMDRQTTRGEDMAYALLGILDITIVANYGEGRERAFKRLRREAKEVSDDPPVVLRAEGQKELLQALQFPHIEARRLGIKNAHSDTCAWLLKDPGYLGWLDNDRFHDHHGFLWIKGKPGSGKSTLMKFAHAQACKTSSIPTTIVSFFFNARGVNLERSATGAYRSLLYQIISNDVALARAFDQLNLSHPTISLNFEWEISALETVLEAAIMLLENRSTICYIDALDECEEQQVRDMVRFFERIGHQTSSLGIQFRICFSSRHYPHIKIRHAINIVLEGQQEHSRGISTYLKSELDIGETIAAQVLRREVLQKASGVFMWVVLVVNILNKEYDRGRVHQLRQKLREIPDDLHNLLYDILTRGSYDDRDVLLLCVQWALFAKKPLSVAELHSAILFGTETSSGCARSETIIHQNAMERFILDSSRGVIEVIASGDEKGPIIQFIHQSVKDFLLEGDGLGRVWPEYQTDFVSRSHERLKGYCVEYIWGSNATGPLVVDIRRLPFLQYVVENVLYHADTAGQGGIEQRDFLRSFPLTQWSELTNRFTKFAGYTENVSLLYVLAHRNLVNLLRLQPLFPFCIEVTEEFYGCPLFAAAANSSEGAIQAILEGLMTGEVSYSIPTRDRPLCEYATALSREFQRGSQYLHHRSVLSYAAAAGVTPLVAYLLKNTANSGVDTKDQHGQTPLWWASSRQRSHTAYYSDERLPNKSREDSYHHTIHLLLEHGANVNNQNSDDETPLYAAALKGYSPLVRLLLEYGANVNMRGGHHGFALLAALNSCSPSHEETVEALLDTDSIDVNVRLKSGDTPLIRAIWNAQDTIVSLLLSKGADIDEQDSNGWSPLIKAVQEFQGNLDVVTLLLEKGANVNHQCRYYGNALHIAALRGHREVVDLLIRKGANVNMEGGEYITALQAAASRNTRNPTAPSWELHVVQMLIDGGANVNVQGGHYGTALQAAAHRGNEAVVKLLIASDADVNAQTGKYGTALQAASYSGHEKIVKLLIEQGSNVNAQCGKYGNALNAAVHCLRGGRTQEAILELLRSNGAVEQRERKRQRTCV